MARFYCRHFQKAQGDSLMKIAALLFAAFLLLGCTQAPATKDTPSATPTATLEPGLSDAIANAEDLFKTPGYARYQVTITFPSNLTEQQAAIAEFMQSLLQGQQSGLAWDGTGTFRLDTQVGLLGESLNQTTFLNTNNSTWCLNGECEAAETQDTEERLDVARNALSSPYAFLKLPAGVDPARAWTNRPSGPAQYAGRTCDGYELTLNQTYLNQTLYSRPAGELEDVNAAKQVVLLKGITTPLRTCLDRERGFVAFVRFEVDLSKARNDDELKGLVMIMTQTIGDFQDTPPAGTLDAPEAEPARTKAPSSANALPLGAVTLGSDGIRYGYIGKQNASYLLNVSHVNASCAPKMLQLPEWTTYECNGTVHLFLVEESQSDEFELAYTKYAFTPSPYDPTTYIVYVLEKDKPVPLSNLPLILMYEGTAGSGESILIGPWEGPCPTQRLGLSDKAETYACEGTEYAVKADGKEDGKLRVRVLRK